MPGELTLFTLRDGAQPAAVVADRLQSFIAAATRSLDIAIYDLKLPPPLEQRLADGIAAARANGANVRLVYNAVGRDRGGHVPTAVPPPYPPPPRTDPESIARLGVPARSIPGEPDLMHHKYVIRDAGTDLAAVWTGSMNWTEDSWTREENLVLQLPSRGLADAYSRNFLELWERGEVAASGHFDADWSEVSYEGRVVSVRPVFSPGRGRMMSHMVADRIGQARRRIRICSPVITSGPVLASLAEVPAGIDCRLVYDRTQMEEVLRQWSADPRAVWKAPIFEAAVQRLPSASKRSTPYSDTSVHDYMHAKLVVADDIVIAGSYNLSHSGEMNAENMVEMHDPGLAGVLAAYVDQVFQAYADG